MANMEVTVYTNAVRIVGMARYVTRCMDIVPPVNLGFKGFSVMKVRIANFTFSLLRSPEYKDNKMLNVLQKQILRRNAVRLRFFNYT